MADQKISALTSATLPLAGTEVLPIVQSGVTKKIATDDLTVKNIRSNATSGILQIVGPVAATTRVVTVPDANWTAARTDAAQTFTGRQTVPDLLNAANRGVSYAETSTSGSTSIVDTGIYGNTANLGWQSIGAVYDVFIGGQGSAGGNAGAVAFSGQIVVSIDTGGNGVISYSDIYHPTAPPSVTALSATAVFWTGSAEVSTSTSNTTNQIRVKVSGYLNNTGYSQKVIITRRF